jgi:hypothetical protein
MFQSKFAGLRWESVDKFEEAYKRRATAEPASPAADTSLVAPVAPEVVKEHPLTEFLRRTKLPRHPDPNASTVAEAEYLLQAASEVEHQFIVQYLYARFSINFETGGELAVKSDTHLEAIAEEEMGHLLTVQNVLLLIGAPPYLERQRTAPPAEQPFPFLLEPIGLPFISRFLVAESPIDAELPDNLGELKETIEHVGALYAMLYWLFQDSDAPQEPWLLPPSEFPAGRHVKPEEYNANTELVIDMLNRADDWLASGDIHVLPPPTAALDTPAAMADAARRALYDIALQGEGPVETGPDTPKETSHYHRLLGIYNALKASPNITLALDVPVNPHLEPVDPANAESEPGLITDRAALRHARLFNLRYAMLLLEIALSVSIPRSREVDNEAVRATLAIRAILVEMIRGVGALSRKLVTIALKASQSGVGPPCAAAPYGLPSEPFPTSERERWELLLSLIDESRAIIEEAGGDLSVEMEDLLERDRNHREFVLARISELT